MSTTNKGGHMDIPEKEKQSRAEQSLRDRLAYTIPDLIRDTGAGRSKIYQEIAAGRLKVRKLGKRTLVLHGDAMAWLEALPAA
jgi:hypothetical protein